MPPGTLDSILNFVIPAGVILGLGFWFYSLVLREPVERFLEWLRNRGGGGNQDPGFGKPEFGVRGDDDDFVYIPK